LLVELPPPALLDELPRFQEAGDPVLSSKLASTSAVATVPEASLTFEECTVEPIMP
jgi:hypothetical protein